LTLPVRRGDSSSRDWLITKPKEQSSLSSRSTIEKVVSGLNERGHQYLLWPTENGLKKIDVQKGEVIEKMVVSITKQDESKRVVIGVVLDPYQEDGGDAHGDFISPSEVEATSHNFVKESRFISFDHREPTEAKVVESFIENYPTPDDRLKAFRGEPHRVSRRKFGKDVIHSGAWVMGVQLTPELWEMAKNGKIKAFSIEGYGVRKPMTPKQLPEIEFVDAVFVDPKTGNKVEA
jgi:hypothetical protein